MLTVVQFAFCMSGALPYRRSERVGGEGDSVASTLSIVTFSSICANSMKFHDFFIWGQFCKAGQGSVNIVVIMATTFDWQVFICGFHFILVTFWSILVV